VTDWRTYLALVLFVAWSFIVGFLAGTARSDPGLVYVCGRAGLGVDFATGQCIGVVDPQNTAYGSHDHRHFEHVAPRDTLPTFEPPADARFEPWDAASDTGWDGDYLNLDGNE
jgi:hypothetical protein